MRTLAAIAFAAVLATAANAPEPTLREFRHKAVGPQALVRSGAGAVFNHIRNVPHEWGRGAAGFGKRVASSLGQHVVKEGIQTGVAAAHHENLHYERSNRQDTWPRLIYAVKRTFVVPSTRNRGGNTVALGRISGNMGAGLISRIWMPASAAGIGAGIASGGVGLGADIGFNVAREFWPRRKSSGKMGTAVVK